MTQLQRVGMSSLLIVFQSGWKDKNVVTLYFLVLSILNPRLVSKSFKHLLKLGAFFRKMHQKIWTKTDKSVFKWKSGKKWNGSIFQLKQTMFHTWNILRKIIQCFYLNLWAIGPPWASITATWTEGSISSGVDRWLQILTFSLPVLSISRSM